MHAPGVPDPHAPMNIVHRVLLLRPPLDDLRQNPGSENTVHRVSITTSNVLTSPSMVTYAQQLRGRGVVTLGYSITGNAAERNLCLHTAALRRYRNL